MGKKIVTVLLEACDTGAILSDHQYVDFTVSDQLAAGLRLGTAVYAAQPIPPEQVPLLPAPDYTPPEREIAHVPAEPAPLVQELYTDARRLYRDKEYAEAAELIADVLHIAPDFADAQQLYALIERRLKRRPSPPITPPEPARPRKLRQSRSHDLMPDPFAWIDIPAGRVQLIKGGYLDKATWF
jgi:hypothetical protein